MLHAAVTTLLDENARASVVCSGDGSETFVERLAAAVPAVKGRVRATGRLPSSDAAAVLMGCDVLLQPYIDGVTTRRTSVMAGLINARPVVTTTGHLTEAVWSETRAVALAPSGDARAIADSVGTLLADDDARAALAARGEKTYRERFSLTHTIVALRRAARGAAA
jgi:glycosyltransferase involved in cell wall biosynthesis